MDFNLMPKQMLVLKSPATEILYGGALASGKSYMMRILAIMFALKIPKCQIYLFRRLYKELMMNHMYGTGGFLDLLKPYLDAGVVKHDKTDGLFNFSNGSKIVLAHCQYEADVYRFDGASINVLMVDESTHFTETMINYLRSKMRLGALEVPDEFRHKMPFILYGSNPGSVGHSYFKRNFVDYGDMNIHRATDEEGGMLRQFVFAKLSDNTIMAKTDPNYYKRVMGLGEKARQKLEGDWSMSDTRAIPELIPETHVLNISGDELPHSWKKIRGYDWGFSAPACTIWSARSNGESITTRDGREINMPKGSMIIFDEDYQKDVHGKGLKLTSAQSCERIKTIDAKYYGIRPGPADNAIYNTDRGRSIADEMKDEGVEWLRSDKRPGSRLNGLQLINNMVFEALKINPERPCLYITYNCKETISELIGLELEKDKAGNIMEDVDTHQPDHCYDVVRYLALHMSREVSISKLRGV